MGMDVFGKVPTKECGEYFRASIWTWSVILNHMSELCGDVLGHELINAMEYNSGAGPDDQNTCTEIAARFADNHQAHPGGIALDYPWPRVTEDGRFVSKEELVQHPGLVT